MEKVRIVYVGTGEQYQTYSPQDTALISTALINSTFGVGDYIECFVKDLDGSIIGTTYTDTQYKIGDVVDPVTGTTNQLFLDPVGDAARLGYDRGIFNVKYNFLTKQLLSGPGANQQFWIKEVSTSRTEIKVARQDLSNSQLADAFTGFNAVLSADAYYPTFYLDFGGDDLVIGINAVYIEENGIGYILFKLYEPLPDIFDTKSTFWVVTQKANSVEYNITVEIAAEQVSDAQFIKGPNFKVSVNDKVGQTTPYYNYATLFNTSFNSSYQQVQSIMQDKGILINTDYTKFENYIHFSSATERLYNFVYKLELIESASAGLTQTNTTQAKIALQSQIDSTITNFDGWEYYLYYTSESTAWPKQNSSNPYVLYSITSSQAQNWLGSVSTVPTAATMSMYWSASYYDNTNKDWLLYATPGYIAEDSQNAPYLVFLNMIGQHFDNIWIYYKDVTNRYSAENNPFIGISMDQVADALRSFGVQLYTNTSVADSLYASLLGLNQTGSNLPPTSSAYATVVRESSSIYPLPGNEWLSSSLYLPSFGDENINRYVITFVTGSPVTSSFQTLPDSQLTGEIYKRLYHNLPYLLKTRGTERGVRALIATYGIPADIMTVHEYGGYNYLDVPGIQEISNTRILTGSVVEISSSLLSPYSTIQYYSNDLENTSITVQAGFSPADSINAAITSSGYVTSSTQPGYFNIMQLIGNPTLQYSSSYTPLDQVSNTFFTNTFPDRNNVWDFIRIIKYYNNSLFKMLRDWVPARVSADTGIVIKSHMLERNKYPRHEPTWTTSSFTASLYLLELSASDGGAVIGNTDFIQVVPIQYNGTTSMALTASSGYVNVSQSYGWPQYTGEFDGTTIIAATNYFPQEEVSSYIFPWTSSIPGNGPLFLTYSLGPLYQNVNIPVRSQRFLDLDFNGSQLAPTNYGLITQSIELTTLLGNITQSEQPYSQYAYVQDYNYFSRAYTIPRYSGSYLSGLYYNDYTPGDISYGKEPVIDWYSGRLGLFTQIATSSFFPGKVNVSLAYFADVSGGLFELNQNNKNWVDIQNTFKAGTTLTIKQFDNKKYSNQTSTDGIKSIYNSGYNYTPQLYFKSGSDTKLYFEYLGSEVVSPFTGFVSGSPNSFISGTASPQYGVSLTPGTTVRKGVIYNYLDGESPLSSDFATGSAGVWPSFTASIAGQRTFTINLGLNVGFPDPQTFGDQNAQYTWGAYRNGTELIGAVQALNFSSQYSAGTGTGSISGITPSGNVGILDGPYGLSSAFGAFNVVIDGVGVGTVNGYIEYSPYVITVGGNTYGQALLATYVSGDLTSYITTVDFSNATIIDYIVSPPVSPEPVNTTGSFQTLNYTTPPVNLVPGDKVDFRFTQSFVTTDNFTASFAAGISNSYLTTQPASVGQGGYPFASTGSSGFITTVADIGQNYSVIFLNSEVSSFTQYQFVPFFTSGGIAYSSSLYGTYGDVNYPLFPEFGDKIVMSDFSGVTQEVDVVSGSISNGLLAITVSPQILDNWVANPKLIYKFLLLRKYEDEQNVILTFNKNPGATSYGFIIPDTISPEVVDNINTLQASVQSQILTQQSIEPGSSFP